MKKQQLHIPLKAAPEQVARLKALQAAFAEVCNALAPLVQQHRCWHRVTLHHLAYHGLRERFPQIGSQMVCNAIYSVSRTCRLVLQHPRSPWNITRQPDKPLPLLRFLPESPVYFDRHTLSLKKGGLSMYTLDGRMHFDLALSAQDQARFRNERLREIVLTGSAEGFRLTFTFGEEPQGDRLPPGSSELPEYVLVDEPGGPAHERPLLQAAAP
jgi:hypothetical protein